MAEGAQKIVVESVALASIAEALQQTLPFSGTKVADLGDVGMVDRVTAAEGAVLSEPGMPVRDYWVLLDGEISVERPEPDGSQTLVGVARSGEGFGETLMLLGKVQTHFYIHTVKPSVLIRFGVEVFWKLMSCCPSARAVILVDLAQRLQDYQVEALHREKLISLGTLAAGLMHELHNPGSAAKRASSQLRLNLLRLQELSLRFSDEPKTDAQLECMRKLLTQTMSGCHAPAMSSLEQSDTEEAMSEWLAASGVDNAFSIAPALVGIGLARRSWPARRTRSRLEVSPIR
jgi:CRP-like cAMP-binding protein